MTPEEIEASGGSAFPKAHDSNRPDSQGMTLRDYFAAKAMQGLISSPRVPVPIFNTDQNVTDTMIAGLAYKFADAMLQERSK